MAPGPTDWRARGERRPSLLSVRGGVRCHRWAAFDLPASGLRDRPSPLPPCGCCLHSSFPDARPGTLGTSSGAPDPAAWSDKQFDGRFLFDPCSGIPGDSCQVAVYAHRYSRWIEFVAVQEQSRHLYDWESLSFGGNSRHSTRGRGPSLSAPARSERTSADLRSHHTAPDGHVGPAGGMPAGTGHLDQRLRGQLC